MNNACQCPDSTYAVNTATQTCYCPLLTTLVGNTCVNCTITGCTTCSASNVCSVCINNMVPVGSTCGCNNTNLTVVNNMCVCKTSTAPVQTQSGLNCVPCGQFCIQCISEVNCSQCTAPFLVTTNTSANTSICSCPNTYVNVGSTCACPTGYS